MITTLRRGGSAVAMTWDAQHDPADAGFLEMLRSKRFLSIERAASEETSVGWVTPGDPTGETFALDDMVAGNCWWLRFRMDAKKLPASKLQMEIANAERARGKKLSARERRELKDHLHEQLLPGILPRTTFVDVVLSSTDRRVALVLSSSKAAREAFGELAHASFGFSPTLVTSGYMAEQVLVDRPMPIPTRFPGGGPRQLQIASAADFLGDEFLLWLWWKWETRGGEFTLPGDPIGVVGIAIDDRVEFEAGDDETSLVLRHGLTTRSQEARAALRNGRVPTKVRMLIAEATNQWTVTLDGASLAMGSVRLPEDADDCETVDDRTGDRSAHWILLQQIVARLFGEFLQARLYEWTTVSRELTEWMRGGGS